MRMKILLMIAAAGFALATFRVTTADVAAQNGAALSGTVDKVFMFDIHAEKAQRWDLPKYSGPYTSSTPDPKGRVYAPSNMAERLYRLDPRTGEVVAYQWPTEFDTKKITQVRGPNGNPVLWFTNMRTARVSRVEILE